MPRRRNASMNATPVVEAVVGHQVEVGSDGRPQKLEEK
jgi:hypothetical protein